MNIPINHSTSIFGLICCGILASGWLGHRQRQKEDIARCISARLTSCKNRIPPPVVSLEKRVVQMTQVQKEGMDLFIRKNKDYGDAFAEYGAIGVLMRIEDKLKRSVSITTSGVNLITDEGIRDTLIDLHNYAAMGIMLLDE